MKYEIGGVLPPTVRREDGGASAPGRMRKERTCRTKRTGRTERRRSVIRRRTPERVRCRRPETIYDWVAATDGCQLLFFVIGTTISEERFQDFKYITHGPFG